MEKRPIIILFTGSFPYEVAVEQNFLQVEVEVLYRYFDRVILVPRITEGRKAAVPSKIEIETGYAEFLAKMNKMSRAFRILLSRLFYSEVINNPWLLLSFPAFKRLLYFLIYADSTSEWLTRWLLNFKTPYDQILFYTYWFTDTPMGIGKVRKHFPGIKIISRAHGMDLYEERFDPPYWPCREITLSAMDRVFPDSASGTTYMRSRYPKYKNIFRTARLGVTNPGFVCSASQDGVFRIVSCSMIRKEKRINLLLEGIVSAAKQRPSQRFEWIHFGNGAKKEFYQKRAYSELPTNAIASFPGFTTSENLFRHYQENPTAVFVNVSESEGIPVSIMEAISCGIPVIATSVGGNPEIVSVINGILISPDPNAVEISEVLLLLIDNYYQNMDLRRGSKKIWNEKYNAERNYHKFASDISMN